MSKRLPNLAPPFAKIRNRLANYVRRPLQSLTKRQILLIATVVFILLTTVLIQNPLWRTQAGEQYKEGDILRESIISPADISVTDVEETEKNRQTARESVFPIFTLESNRAESAAQNFRWAWESLQRHGDNSNANARSENSSNARANVREDAKAETHWTGAGGADVGNVFAARRFGANELDAVNRALRESADGRIYNDSDQQYLAENVTLIDRQKPSSQITERSPETAWTAVSAAREKLRSRLAEIRSLSPKEVEAFYIALEPYIQPSVVYDSDATNKAREAAAQSIPPVAIALKRQQRIAGEGDIVTPDVLAKINAIRSYTDSTRKWNRFFGLLFLIAALYWVAWRFIEHRGTVARLTLSPERTYGLFGFVAVIQTLLMAICFRLSEFTALQNIKAPFNDATLWSFAIPFAFASLLTTLLVDRRVALFSGIFSALLAGLLAPKPFEFVLYAAISSAVAVYGIGRYRSRSSVTTAGLLVGGANALVAVALIGYTQQPFIFNSVTLAIACGLLGGVITAAVTAVFLPVCESIFGILTDVKLLELSNADLPVLGQLALRAPGTNQHSHAVGQLAEEACRAVGANALLARIGALYHDIGKTAAPEHFVENQLGKNPHDRLKPAQSAKIIIAHVTYGIKLGKEIGLPQRIIDFIPQHHGTRTLHYFLRKAQAQAGENQEVEESDFRYPGPKPQFKEAAIMMIADSCEAAARSLSHPTPENIRYIITKIIDAILSDDQLDECDLTLRELTLIRESMIKSLVAIYHSRIDYPGYTPPASFAKLIVPADEDSEERGLKYSNPSEIPVSRGGEVEDEAVDRSIQPDSKAEAQTVK
ncbi:MAG: HDIG domain-containing protein [Acidobacteriota bacterium]|nr:HDIG domain-containing protein [Acidobacteriota bacterium]